MEHFQTIREPKKMVIGIQCRTSNDPNAAPKDIPRLWEKFYAEDIFNKIPNKCSDEILFLYCDYEKDYTKPYSCIVGCLVNSLDKIPQGMVGKIIPPSTFAVFHAVGEMPKSIIATWTKIWQSPLKRTYTVDYQIYGPEFATAESKEVEIRVAIEV